MSALIWVEKWEDVFSINSLIHLTELKRRLSSTDISLTIDFVYWWVLYPYCHSRNRPAFAHPIRKTCSFSCRAKGVFPSDETLILPVSRDSRYNNITLCVAKSCAKGDAHLETPILSGSWYSLHRSSWTLFLQNEIGGIGRPVLGTALCRLFICGHLPYRLY